MPRTFFGSKKTVKIDRHTRSKYSESDIRWEKFKIVIWLVLGGVWTYFIIQPQSWF
jgi:hypothetical protein